MPIYSFQCNDCGHKFDRFYFKIKQNETPLCPKCKSNHTTQQIGVTNTRIAENGPSTTHCLPKFGFG